LCIGACDVSNFKEIIPVFYCCPFVCFGFLVHFFVLSMCDNAYPKYLCLVE